MLVTEPKAMPISCGSSRIAHHRHVGFYLPRACGVPTSAHVRGGRHLSTVAAAAAGGHADGLGAALGARLDALVIGGTDGDTARAGRGGGGDGGTEDGDDGEDNGGELHLGLVGGGGVDGSVRRGQLEVRFNVLVGVRVRILLRTSFVEALVLF